MSEQVELFPETISAPTENDFVIEQGEGLADAVSYCSVSYLREHLENATVKSDKELEDILIVSVEHLQGLPWLGEKAISTQALDWPRSGVRLYGYKKWFSNQIPFEIIEAQLCIAESEITGIELSRSVNEMVRPLLKAES